jgi:molecular chaperone DnaK (HSP70)
VKSAVDVDDAAVTRMVEESVEHAFEDLASRRWVEQKLKANELVTATRKGIASCETELAADYVAELEAAMKLVEVAITTEHASGAGDLKQLQSACAKLDEETKPLAELLMDRAMEAMLRRRGTIS